MPEPDATPAQLAAFDQTHAQLSRIIDLLIATYRDIRSENASVREVDIAGMAAYLLTLGYDLENFAELLAVAVVQLAEKETTHA